MPASKTSVALVTGAAQGIGKGITCFLLEHGYTVVMVDQNESAGENTLAEYRSIASPARLYFVCSDISREADVEAALAFVHQHCGRLDALVNNAGVAGAAAGPVEQLSLEAWRRYIDTNLTGAFLMVKHAVPLLRESRGAIVNIASTRALQSEPHSEAYAASKGGLTALTHALAISLGPEIRVNCISPGWIDVRAWHSPAGDAPAPLAEEDHRQHPAGRVGTPKDIASLAAFLLSEEAGFITGQNFVADGGMTRKMIYV